MGVTGPDHGGWPAWLMTKIAVRRAGGQAIRITPRRALSGTDFDFQIDALVVGGGADVSPALYGEQLLPALAPAIKRERRRNLKTPLFDFVLTVILWFLRLVFSSKPNSPNSPNSPNPNEDEARDRLETTLIKKALEREIPVLGICRGMQILNVTLGGSLHQEIAGFYRETPQLRTLLPKKKIEIEPGSRLHKVMGKTLAKVNSLHHQSVNRLGYGLHVAAKEPIGIIQAIEHESYPFAVGVQWHPEYLPMDPTQLALFKRLVKVASLRDDEPIRSVRNDGDERPLSR